MERAGGSPEGPDPSLGFKKRIGGELVDAGQEGMFSVVPCEICGNPQTKMPFLGIEDGCNVYDGTRWRGMNPPPLPGKNTTPCDVCYYNAIELLRKGDLETLKRFLEADGLEDEETATGRPSWQLYMRYLAYSFFDNGPGLSKADYIFGVFDPAELVYKEFVKNHLEMLSTPVRRPEEKEDRTGSEKKENCFILPREPSQFEICVFTDAIAAARKRELEGGKIKMYGTPEAALAAVPPELSGPFLVYFVPEEEAAEEEEPRTIFTKISDVMYLPSRDLTGLGTIETVRFEVRDGKFSASPRMNKEIEEEIMMELRQKAWDQSTGEIDRELAVAGNRFLGTKLIVKDRKIETANVLVDLKLKTARAGLAEVPDAIKLIFNLSDRTGLEKKEESEAAGKRAAKKPRIGTH